MTFATQNQEVTQELSNEQVLADRIRNAVRKELTSHSKGELSEVYDSLLAQVEKPLLETVMRHTRNNQSEAARALGLSRGTLRKKLKKYFGSCYVATRDSYFA